MKKLLLVAAVCATVASPLVGTSTGAPPDTTPPLGQKCTFNSTTDVTREAGWQTGDVRGGPLLAGGTLRCRFIVNADSHSSPNIRAEYKFDSTGGVIIGASTLNYQATALDDIALCSAWDPNGTFGDADTQYWVGGNTAALQFGHWSSNPNDSCGVATSIEPNDPECSIWKAIDRRLGTNIAEIWQDCEPYSEFPLPI